MTSRPKATPLPPLSLRQPLDASLADLTLALDDTGNMEVRNLLGERIVDPLRQFNDRTAAAHICTLDTTRFSDPRAVLWAQAHLPSPPNLLAIDVSETSLVFPAEMATQHSPMYPATLQEMAGHITAALNPGINAAGIPKLEWILEVEHPDDLRYARLCPGFTIPPSVRHLSIKVVPKRTKGLGRKVVLWIKPMQDARLPPLAVKAESVASLSDLAPGSQFMAREAHLSPEATGQFGFFGQLALAAARLVQRPTIELVGAECWPADWVSRLGPQLSFRFKFLNLYFGELMRARRIPRDRVPSRWEVACNNIVITPNAEAG